MKKILALSLLLTGCSLVPDYKAPDVATPDWNNTTEVTNPQVAPEEKPQSFWARFGNAEMESLIREALLSNNDVNAAIQRIEQARASTQIAGSGLLPALDATAGIGRNYANPGRGASDTDNSWRAGVAASYELDLFGRNRANVGAARASEEAVRFDKDAVALVATSDTAQAFINLLGLNDRLVVAEHNLTNARDVLRIAQARFDAGTLSALELAQQRAALASTEASLAALERQREGFRNQLAVLLGKTPQDFAVKSQSLADFTLPVVALAQPSQIVLKRPDIRAAEADLRAANYDIGAARAAFFPNISLSAGASLAASPLSAPVDVLADIGAAAAQPLFSGGAISGGVDLARARKLELEENYKKTVLTSFREVQDALAAKLSADAQAAKLAQGARDAQVAYDLARQRFDAGVIDFTTLLDTQRSLYSAQSSLIDAGQAQYIAVVDLYRAGGGEVE